MRMHDPTPSLRFLGFSSQSTASAHLAISPVEQLDDRQPVRAGGLGGGQVGAGDLAGFGRQGLVELGGALALAVDLVIPQVTEDIRHGHAVGGRLAVLPAAVAVEVRGRLAIFLELLLLAQGERVVASWLRCSREACRGWSSR